VQDLNYLDLLGKPFVRGARGPYAYDCYGLVIEMNRRAGIVLPDFVTPNEIERAADLVSQASGAWTRVPLRTPGATVVFRVEGVGAHVGYMLDNTDFIHAFETTGVLVESILRAPWNDRAIQAYIYGA